MSALSFLSGLFVIASVVGLLALGLFLALRSGVADLNREQDRRRFAANLSLVLLRLAGFGAGMFALQRLIGVPIGGW